MKKGWKIFFIADGIILALGIVLCFVSWVVGDRPVDMFNSDKWIRRYEWSVNDEDTYVEFDAIDISCKMGELVIQGTDAEDDICVRGEGINTDIEVVEKDGVRVLTGKDDEEFLGKVTIMIPKNKKLRYIRTSVGAGELEMNYLSAEEVKVKVGTGEASLRDVFSDDIVLQCEMGDVEYEHSALGILDFNYDLSCKAGEIDLNDVEYSGLNFGRKIDNEAERNIKVSCKTGSVSLSFVNGGSMEKHHGEQEMHEGGDI